MGVAQVGLDGGGRDDRPRDGERQTPGVAHGHKVADEGHRADRRLKFAHDRVGAHDLAHLADRRDGERGAMHVAEPVVPPRLLALGAHGAASHENGELRKSCVSDSDSSHVPAQLGLRVGSGVGLSSSSSVTVARIVRRSSSVAASPRQQPAASAKSCIRSSVRRCSSSCAGATGISVTAVVVSIVFELRSSSPESLGDSSKAHMRGCLLLAAVAARAQRSCGDGVVSSADAQLRANGKAMRMGFFLAESADALPR